MPKTRLPPSDAVLEFVALVHRGARTAAHAALEAMPIEATSLVLMRLCLPDVHNMALTCKLLSVWVRAYDEIHLDLYEFPRLRVQIDVYAIYHAQRSIRSFTVAFDPDNAQGSVRCQDHGRDLAAQMGFLLHPSCHCFDSLQQLALENLRHSANHHRRMLSDAVTAAIADGRLPHLQELTLTHMVDVKSMSVTLRAISKNCPKMIYLDLRK